MYARIQDEEQRIWKDVIFWLHAYFSRLIVILIFYFKVGYLHTLFFYISLFSYSMKPFFSKHSYLDWNKVAVTDDVSIVFPINQRVVLTNLINYLPRIMSFNILRCTEPINIRSHLWFSVLPLEYHTAHKSCFFQSASSCFVWWTFIDYILYEINRHHNLYSYGRNF